MKLDFGRHRGRSVASLVATEPDYLVWMLRLDDPSPRMTELRDEAHRLIRLANEAPWAERCPCGREALHAEVRRHAGVVLGLRVVCDSCRGVTRRAIHSYGTAVGKGRLRGDRRLLAREFLRVKGLRPRRRAEAFFAELATSTK